MKQKKIYFLIVFCLQLICSLFAQTNEDCMMCHEDKELTKNQKGKTVSLFVNINKYNNSAHGQKKCTSCHTDAKGEEFPHNEKLKKINCNECHGDIESSEETSVHKIVKAGENAPDCIDCHSSTHYMEKPSKVIDKAGKYCNQCHNFDKISRPYHQSNELNNSCTECHTNINHRELLKKSVHASLSCTACHGYVAENFEIHADNPTKSLMTDCYVCHETIVKEHKESIHGLSLYKNNNNEAAQCWHCHGSHSILKSSDKNSLTNGKNLIANCAKCHDSKDFAIKHELSVKQPAELYSKSVHGMEFLKGNKNTAICTSCHGVHNIKNRLQADSKIAASNIANTCSECHKEIADQYSQSVHMIGVKRGVRNSPTCNDCHSEHNVRTVSGKKNHKERVRMQQNTCLKCHSNMILSERYGMQENNANNYLDSYHGLAFLKGDKDAAMCTDCHGVHKILPAHHDESMVSDKNIVSTCKKCHPGAKEIFSKSYSHKATDGDSISFAVKLAENIYFWLIFVVIGAMVAHNFIIFRHDILLKRRKRNNTLKIPRFTTNELIQHTVLLVSFLLLAITGFNLKYPDEWWSKILFSLGLSESLRQVMHRVAAVVMMILSIYHFIYLIATARGRFVLSSFLPRISDFKLAFSNIAYNLGLNKKYPYFGNYSYIDKLEYWALIWGTLLMAITGMFLWFPTMVGDWAPVWFIKVCEAVHFYEAVLATLAIIVWHWFFVMFRPKEYPLNFTCIDGKITIGHFKEEHKQLFFNIVAEYLDHKKGSNKKLSYYCHFFIETLKKNNVDVNLFIEEELQKNEDLQDFIETGRGG